MTAPEDPRTRPPTAAGEREMLESWLDFHRETLLWKCAGLTDEQLKKRACPPSTLTLLGLVRPVRRRRRAGLLDRRVAGRRLRRSGQGGCRGGFRRVRAAMRTLPGAGRRPGTG